MSNHFKVHELIADAAELAELEEFARQPGRTIDEVHTWLAARGYTMSRGAVGNWMADFRKRELVDRMNSAGGLAKAFMDAAKDSGGLAVHDAAILQVGQMVFEAAAAKSSGAEIDNDDLTKMALALQRLTLAKGRIEKVRDEFMKRQQEALEEASKVAQSGGSGASVVDKVREILGIGGRAA